MKKNKLIKYLLILTLVVGFQACEDKNESEFHDTLSTEGLAWQDLTNLDITATEGMELFLIYRDRFNGDLSWGNKTIQLNMTLNSALPITEFSKVEFYVTAEEKNGYNYSAPYDTQGKSIGTVSSFGADGEFTFELDGNELGLLFASEFTKPRNDTSLIDGDLIELHWVITGGDGGTMDSRNSSSGDYIFGIQVRQVDVAPPIFKGTFNYEWNFVGFWNTRFTNVYTGLTGTMNIGLKVASFTEFEVDHLGADYSPGSNGVLIYDFDSGLVTIVVDSSWQTWNITKVEGNTLTIDYPMLFGEVGTFTLTRTDDQDWPTNIHTN